MKAPAKKAAVKKTGPLMQTKKPATKKKVAPKKKKEETFLEGVKRVGGNIASAAKNTLRSTKYDDSRSGSGSFFGLDIEGSDAGTYRPERNPLSSQYGKTPAQQKRPMPAKGNKKATAKMRKY